MKAAAFVKTGGPEVIQFLDLPDPIAGPDDVIVRTEAVGLNFADIQRRKGVYDTVPPPPYVLGYEGAGVIVQVGSSVKHLTKGTRVGFAHVPRANAELVKAPAWKVIPLTSAISFDTAAGILLQGLTAQYLTHDSFQLKKGQTALIHSASGGVGLLLLQICKLLGAKTIGTVSTDDKVALAKKAGADEVIVRTEPWKKRVLDLTNGRGVDVAYDAIGITLLDSIDVTKPHGTVVYYGEAGGAPPSIDPNSLMKDSKVLVGGELWSHIDTNESLLRRADLLFSWVEQGKLVLAEPTKYALSKAMEAHRALESGKSQGKHLLIPSDS